MKEKNQCCYDVITGYFDDVFLKYPQIDKKMLKEQGTIFCTHSDNCAENGIDFGCICEFSVAYKNSYCFCNVCVYCNGNVRGYVFFDNEVIGGEGVSPDVEGVELDVVNWGEEHICFLYEFLTEEIEDEFWCFNIKDFLKI